jgi:hypothetical protein
VLVLPSAVRGLVSPFHDIGPGCLSGNRTAKVGFQFKNTNLTNFFLYKMILKIAQKALFRKLIGFKRQIQHASRHKHGTILNPSWFGAAD